MAQERRSGIKMIAGGKKFEKTKKSKMRKYEEGNVFFKQEKKRQKDKRIYRLMREEENAIS